VSRRFRLKAGLEQKPRNRIGLRSRRSEVD
jgi:hypothetical protein